MTISRPFRDRPPLDRAALERLALAYAGRFATSRARLVAYLGRKVAERGWSDPTPPDLEAIADRFAELGYVDDAALAEARGRSLARRGLGERRVADTLRHLGIGAQDGAAAIAAAEREAWTIALRFAERRRIGPFAKADAEPGDRRRAMAAMLRAGHRADHVRKIVASAPGVVPGWDEY